jgi:predicted nucleic acid-binding protein
LTRKRRESERKGGYLPYADTDFFIALSNDEDRHNKWAEELLKRYKGNIYTSVITLVELALVSVRRNQPVETLIASVLSIAELSGLSKNAALGAAHLIDHKSVSVFDAFHASLCGDEIISSDHIFDKLGMTRLGKELI